MLSSQSDPVSVLDAHRLVSLELDQARRDAGAVFAMILNVSRLGDGGLMLSLAEGAGTRPPGLPDITSVSLPVLLAEGGRWHRSRSMGLGADWVKVFAESKVNYLAALPIHDAEGFAAVVLFGGRSARQRPVHRVQGAALGRAVRSLRRAVHALLQFPAMVVWGERGELVAASDWATEWLNAERARGADVHALCAAAATPNGGCTMGFVQAECTSVAGSVSLVARLTATACVPFAAGIGLSPRVLEAAEFASAGATSAEIARAMGIGTETVRGYLKEVYRELGVSNRVELARCMASLSGDSSTASQESL